MQTGKARKQGGAALFVALIFLVILSVVAVVAMRGTLFEMRMVTNAARHEQAFEVSEFMRGVPLQVFDLHVFNRGWPTTWGGGLPDADFPNNFTDRTKVRVMFGSALQAAQSPKLYIRPQGDCSAVPAPAGCQPLWDQESWDTTLTLQMCQANAAMEGCGAKNSAISIVPDGVTLGSGAGGAQGAGYRGVGSGAATGGANMYFEVKSVGTAAANAQATTIGQYKQVIRN